MKIKKQRTTMKIKAGTGEERHKEREGREKKNLARGVNM